VGLTVAKLSDTLQTVFTAAAEQAARQAGLIRRRRLLTGPAFVQGLVFTWLRDPQASYEDLAAGVADAGAPLAVSALEGRFTPAAADCLRRVLEHAVGQLLAADPAAGTALAAFSDVCLDDASVIALPAALAGLWPGCGGRGQGGCRAALKLYVRLGLRGGALRHLQLLPGRTADQSAPLQALPLPPGGLRVADLGFFDLDALQEQDRRGCYFLSKLQTGTLAADPRGDFAALLAHLRRHRGRTLDKPVRLGRRHGLAARLLAVRLPKALVRRRRKRARAEAGRKGRTPDPRTLELCRWLVLVTNAPREKLSLPAALALYRARWQVELLFKLWKGHGGIAASRSGKPWRVLCEVYAKLLGMLVQHWVLLLRVWRYEDRSLVKAAKRVRARVAQLLDELPDAEGLKRVLTRIMRSLERGCRTQRRKKHPSTFQLLLHPDLLDSTDT
jgi:hypothetical protein